MATDFDKPTDDRPRPPPGYDTDKWLRTLNKQRTCYLYVNTLTQVRVTDAVHVSIHTISHNLYITVLFPPAASAIFLQKVTGLRPPSFVDAEEERRRARRSPALPSATDDVHLVPLRNRGLAYVRG